jgi:hypothetical protein
VGVYYGRLNFETTTNDVGKEGKGTETVSRARDGGSEAERHRGRERHNSIVAESGSRVGQGKRKQKRKLR